MKIIKFKLKHDSIFFAISLILILGIRTKLHIENVKKKTSKLRFASLNEVFKMENIASKTLLQATKEE